MFHKNIIEGGPQAIKIKEAVGTRIVNNIFVGSLLLEWINATTNVVKENYGLIVTPTVAKVRGDTCFIETDEDQLGVIEYEC